MEKYPARDSVILWDAASLAAAQRKTASVHAARNVKSFLERKRRERLLYLDRKGDSSRPCFGFVLETGDAGLLSVATHARGPAGLLPLTAEMLLSEPSGNLFGLTQNAGMGWSRNPSRSRVSDIEHAWRLRAENGEPIALGFTVATGRWDCWWLNRRGN